MVLGICTICGTRAQLTDEHLPPRKAFNDAPLMRWGGDLSASLASGSIVRTLESIDSPRVLKNLCKSCNNRTGSWYGTDYRDYARRAAESRIPAGERGTFSFRGRPAAIAKQALVMLATSSGAQFAERFPEVRRLILHNKRRSRPADFRLSTYLLVHDGGNETGLAGSLNCKTGRAWTGAEFSHWALGWLFSVGTEAPSELCDVTHWLDCEYSVKKEVCIKVHRLWALTGYPLDYRSPPQIHEDYLRNVGLD